MINLRTWQAWTNIHQPFELKWWQDHIPKGHSDDPGFTEQWQAVKDWIQPKGHVIDIGCGPRPPFAPCTVIDPLIEEYQKFTPPEWWEGVSAYTGPAEGIIPNLKGDTIICWNCLDHTIGWRQILRNMVRYANPGAKIAVATDFQLPFEGHPGFSAADFHHEIQLLFNVKRRRSPFGRDLALLMEAKGTDGNDGTQASPS